MRKPRLTKNVAKGLQDIHAFVEVNCHDGSELYFGNSPEERRKILAALDFIGNLAEWKLPSTDTE